MSCDRRVILQGSAMRRRWFPECGLTALSKWSTMIVEDRTERFPDTSSILVYSTKETLIGLFF